MFCFKSRTFAAEFTANRLGPAIFVKRLKTLIKIDKQKLFAYILQDGKRMSLTQLRQVVMNVMKISSYNFASSILTQAMSENIIRSITLDQGGVFYELSDGQEAIF